MRLAFFQGDKYAKYERNFAPSSGNYPRLVTDGFPGVLTPVDGAFQLNNHTFVFVSGKQMNMDASEIVIMKNFFLE